MAAPPPAHPLEVFDECEAPPLLPGPPVYDVPIFKQVKDTLPERLAPVRQHRLSHVAFPELLLSDEAPRRESCSAALRSAKAGWISRCGSTPGTPSTTSVTTAACSRICSRCGSPRPAPRFWSWVRPLSTGRVCVRHVCADQVVDAIEAASAAVWLPAPVTSQFASEVEVFFVGLLERVAQCIELVVAVLVLLLQVGDLSGECDDECAVTVNSG